MCVDQHGNKKRSSKRAWRHCVLLILHSWHHLEESWLAPHDTSTFFTIHERGSILSSRWATPNTPILRLYLGLQNKLLTVSFLYAIVFQNSWSNRLNKVQLNFWHKYWFLNSNFTSNHVCQDWCATPQWSPCSWVFICFHFGYLQQKFLTVKFWRSSVKIHFWNSAAC